MAESGSNAFFGPQSVSISCKCGESLLCGCEYLTGALWGGKAANVYTVYADGGLTYGATKSAELIEGPTKYADASARSVKQVLGGNSSLAVILAGFAKLA